MGFENSIDNNMFHYKNSSFEELVYVYNDKLLMKFLERHGLVGNKNIFEEYIDSNFIDNFKFILVENRYHVNFTDYFKSGYKFYSDEIKSNIRNREISLSNQP
ncbi:MAG: hypothetical protein ACK4IX_12220 [Candidatus Sericytochromatia bacterium]